MNKTDKPLSTAKSLDSVYAFQKATEVKRQAVTDPRTVAGIHTVADIPEHFALVQDSQDIHATLESCGLLTYESETGCLFAEVLDGDYGDIYMCTRYTPVLTARVYKIRG